MNALPSTARGPTRAQTAEWLALVLLPLAGLAILLAEPSADIHWEHHPSHFWLVLSASVISAGLAFATGEAARHRADARLFLVSLAFLAAAGFLGLHALATPGVLLAGKNAGFVLATPVGLLVAAVLSALSAAPLEGRRGAWVMTHATALRAGLIALMGVWAVLSLASVPPLDDPTPPESGSAPLTAMAVVGLALYGIAAWRYAKLYRRRPAPILLSIVTAFVLLAEAMVAVAFARNWHASWWEWHLLMLAAFALIALGARREPQQERFSELYLEDTTAARREVSVMFADLAGFTAFSSDRDPREVSEMLNAYFDVAIPAIVRRHGGHIDQLVGDEIMATFNTRGDQPDHAERAARAALDVQAETGRLAAEHPHWPRFRIGVNTGEALVGLVGRHEGRRYTIVGDMVNTAARIEHAAPVGAVAIGPRTLATIPAATTRSLGPVSLRGKPEPVEVYVLEAL